MEITLTTLQNYYDTCVNMQINSNEDFPNIRMNEHRTFNSMLSWLICLLKVSVTNKMLIEEVYFIV